MPGSHWKRRLVSRCRKAVDIETGRKKEEDDGKIVRSKCGHLYEAPDVEQVKVFKISGPKFVKLNRGTWHAGPLFTPDSMDFYNLELTNTNVRFPSILFLMFGRIYHILLN